MTVQRSYKEIDLYRFNTSTRSYGLKQNISGTIYPDSLSDDGWLVIDNQQGNISLYQNTSTGFAFIEDIGPSHGIYGMGGDQAVQVHRCLSTTEP